MTPNKTTPPTLDERLLDQVIVCDALLHDSAAARERGSAGTASAPAEDDLARSRLLLLLRLVKAAQPASDNQANVRSASDEATPDLGETLLGRFEIIEEIGAGGFGFVVRAVDRLLGREVALKMPLPDRVLAPGDVRRFLREAQAAARLDHPNIVRVYDAGEIGPLGYYIASEYCLGPSLRRWLKGQNGPVPARLAARWLACLADAVQHAHDRGILHRDIKPDNVILASGRGPEDVIPRLTDFGLAKLLAESIDETRSDARMGTPHYMAPEQAAGRKNEVGPATDVYALGATLYEILCGRPPLRGETDVESLRLLLDAEPVTLRALRPGLPRDLETICLKCLRKEPARRYASAVALQEDLERWLDDRPIVGRPVSSWERARAWSHRRPAVASLLGLVVLLAGGLVGGAVRWSDQLRRHNRQLQKAIIRADQKTSEAKEQALIAEERRHRADRHHYAESLRLARRALDSRQIELAQDILHDIRQGTDGVDPRGFAWHYLWRRAHREFSQLWGHQARITDHDVASNGRRLVTCDETGKVLLWDLEQGKTFDEPGVIQFVPDPDSNRIWFSNDGRSIAKIRRETPSHFIDVFDFGSAHLITRLDCGKIGWFGGAVFDNVSKRLAIGAARPDGATFVQSWNLIDGKPEHHSWPIKEGATFSAVLPDERCLIVNKDGLAILLDPWTGEPRVEFAGSDLSHWAKLGLRSLSDNGQVFAAHTNAAEIAFWNTGSGCELARCPVPEGASKIALSSTGSRLAILTPSEKLSVFERASRRSTVLNAGLGRHAKGHSL